MTKRTTGGTQRHSMDSCFTNFELDTRYIKVKPYRCFLFQGPHLIVAISSINRVQTKTTVTANGGPTTDGCDLCPAKNGRSPDAVVGPPLGNSVWRRSVAGPKRYRVVKHGKTELDSIPMLFALIMIRQKLWGHLRWTSKRRVKSFWRSFNE